MATAGNDIQHVQEKVKLRDVLLAIPQSLERPVIIHVKQFRTLEKASVRVQIPLCVLLSIDKGIISGF